MVKNQNEWHNFVDSIFEFIDALYVFEISGVAWGAL